MAFQTEEERVAGASVKPVPTDGTIAPASPPIPEVDAAAKAKAELLAQRSKESQEAAAAEAAEAAKPKEPVSNAGVLQACRKQYLTPEVLAKREMRTTKRNGFKERQAAIQAGYKKTRNGVESAKRAREAKAQRAAKKSNK